MESLICCSCKKINRLCLPFSALNRTDLQVKSIHWLEGWWETDCASSQASAPVF